MGNIGNFSDELLRKDFSKFTVGFIPFIDSSSEESIVQHLMVICGHSRTLAEYSLKIFKLEIDKYFWKEVLTPISSRVELDCPKEGALIWGTGMYTWLVCSLNL